MKTTTTKTPVARQAEAARAEYVRQGGETAGLDWERIVRAALEVRS